MKASISFISPQWLGSVVVIVIAVLATLGYDLGWQLGLPLWLRNLFGLILFFCIMLGCGIGYISARCFGAGIKKSVKIALLAPALWHLKEMLVAANIYGLAQGFYIGLQGPYLFYYCSMMMVMGVSHFLYESSCRLKTSHYQAKLFSTGYFFLPMLIVGGLEGGFMAVFGFDLFVFQGFLAGYKTLFM
jgi:hypothetical protein